MISKFLTPQHKFVSKAHRGIFLGFAAGSKSYKFFYMELKRIIVSREVEFFEDNFPFFVIDNFIEDHSLIHNMLTSSKNGRLSQGVVE